MLLIFKRFFQHIPNLDPTHLIDSRLRQGIDNRDDRAVVDIMRCDSQCQRGDNHKPQNDRQPSDKPRSPVCFDLMFNMTNPVLEICEIYSTRSRFDLPHATCQPIWTHAAILTGAGRQALLARLPNFGWRANYPLILARGALAQSHKAPRTTKK